MCVTFSSFFRRVFYSKREYKLYMAGGVDGTGNTTILYQLKLGKFFITIPTIGFNVETIEYRNICLTFWDAGGSDKMRHLWRHCCYPGTHGIIFVVDSSHPDRLEWATYELLNLLGEPELRDTVVLVLANKQDLPNAISVEEISSTLRLSSIRSHKCYVQPCSGLTGDGLYEGLDWLIGALADRDDSGGTMLV